MGIYWLNVTRTMKMLGAGIVFLGIVVLLYFGLVFPHAVAEAAGGKVIYVDDDAEGADDGTSWADAFPDLQAALAAADEGDQIWIARGTYYPTSDSSDRDASFVMKQGVEIYGGFAGDEDPMFNLDERDFVMNETVLSGDIDGNGELSGNVYHVINNYRNKLDETAGLDGVTIEGGNASGDKDDQSRGGGIFNYESNPTFRNLIIQNNYARDGAGMYNYSGKPILQNIIFRNNQAGYSGGGLSNNRGESTLIHVTLLDNRADYGAAVFNHHDGTIVMINVKIQGNEAFELGGGVYSTGVNLQLTNVLISGNTGGGILSGIGTVILTNVTISGNHGYGINSGSDNILQNTLVWNNQDGNRFGYSASLTIENSLLQHFNDELYGHPDSDSIFVNPGEVDDAPTTAGDYRLKKGSFAIAAGSNHLYDLSLATTDLAGNARIHGTIDLGAYESEWYAVGVSSSFPDGGSVHGAGHFMNGEMATIRATTNVGYTFVNWTEENVEVSREAEYSFAVAKERLLVAHFVDQTAPAIKLDYSPEIWTNDKVTIIVYATDEGSGIDVVKWAEGDVKAADFDGHGTVLKTGSFKAESNGTYTVYARDVAGNEAVESIHIANINTDAPLLTLTPSTAEPTNENVVIGVTALVYGSDDGNTLVKLNWMAGSLDVADFAKGTSGEDILSNGQFSVPTNGTYTVYAQDAAGNEVVKPIAISNIHAIPPVLTLKHAPEEPTRGEITISVTSLVYGSDSGNFLTKLSWQAGSLDAIDFAGGKQGEDILATGQFAVTKNGTYTVYALDAAGNEAVKEIAISTIRRTPSSTDVDDSPVTEPSEDGRRLLVDASMITVATLEDGTVIEVVRLDDATLDKVMAELIDSEKPVLTVQVDDQEDGVKLTLPTTFVRNISASVEQAVIEMRLNGASYRLAVQVLDVEAIAAQMDVTLADLNLSLIIAKASGETVQDIERIASAQGVTVVSEVLDFKIIAEANGRSLEISEFGGTYMPRSIVAQASSGYQTGVTYDPVARLFSFIPSLIHTRQDGTEEAILLAPHNSLYLVIESEGKTFADTEDHWAQADIELLASKFIIYGVSATQFAPDNDLTRAEFTALLVRALGLSSSKQVTNSRFADVDANAWYAQVVETAVAAGLAQGQDADHFAPHEQMTREQVAVMVSRALELAGAAVADEGDELANYVDQDRIAEWARQAVARTSAAEIMQGYPDGTFAPQKIVTRAEAAAILKRFLQAVSFIN